MDKNYGPVFPQHEIGLSRQTGQMESVPEPARMQSLANKQLGFCIFSPDAGHHPASGFLAYEIRQGPAVSLQQGPVSVQGE